VHTERGFDRIVNFSDATVAIAMTLLVLPLVEVGGEFEEGGSLWQLLRDNGEGIFGFLLSFLVIWAMWVNHHQVMEYFATYDSTVLALHMIWLLTIVSIPFTTELITNEAYHSQGAIPLYVAVLLVSSVCLHVLGMRGRSHPELLYVDRPEVKEWLEHPFRWTTVILLAVILVIVLAFPALGASPMLLLFASSLIEGAIDKRRGPAAN
jgi:uncharacterized membrane protein